MQPPHQAYLHVQSFTAPCLVTAILLGSIKVPYDELKRRIIEVDEEQLSPQVVEQLIKYMPQPEQMTQLAELKAEYKQLAEPEQFGVVVCASSSVAVAESQAVSQSHGASVSFHSLHLLPCFRRVSRAGCEAGSKTLCCAWFGEIFCHTPQIGRRSVPGL